MKLKIIIIFNIFIKIIKKNREFTKRNKGIKINISD